MSSGSVDLGASTSSGGGGGGSGGTVTQVNTAGLATGGPITTTGTITVSSISLSSQVTGNLPLSQTSGSISLTNQVVGILPAANTTTLDLILGSVSLSAQTSGSLPLSRTTGSISLTNQVVNNLPLSQTSGSISLTNQVSGILPILNGGLGTSSGLNTFASNLGLFTTVGSSNFAISLTQSDGVTVPAAGSGAVALAIKTISSSGAYSIVTQSSALSVTALSGATFGLLASTSSYVWVYAINDASVMDLGLSAAVFDDGALNPTVPISAASTSNSILYSAASHSGSVGTRLIGRLTVSEGVIGTWDRPADQVSLLPVPTVKITDWTAYTPTLSQGMGSTSAVSFRWKRVGADLFINGIFMTGTTNTATPATVSLPAGNTFDNTKMAQRTILGPVQCLATTGGAVYNAIYLGSTSQTAMVYTLRTGAGGATPLGAPTASIVLFSADLISVTTSGFPILGWSTYGP